jgi:hypothetical protein
MRNSHRILRATLAVYLGLVLQPCVMAMGHAPQVHHDDCHREAMHLDRGTCLSQPALDCLAGDSIVDARDAAFEALDAQLVTIVPVASDPVARGNEVASRYFGRAPPYTGPPLNVRLCVFLK